MPGARPPVQVATYQPNQLVIQTATVGFRILYHFSAFVSTVSFAEIPLRQVKRLPVHLDNDFRPLNFQRKLCTHPPIPFQCRLSFHCCCYCYCCRWLEALRDAPCASLALPAVRRLHLSFRLPGPNLVFQVVAVQVAVAHAEAATPNRCCCYLLLGSYLMPVALEAALRAMSLALRLLHTRFLGGLSKTIASSLQSLVPFGGRHQDCFHAGTTLF